MVLRTESLGNEVRVFELITLHAPRRFEADTERLELLLALARQKSDDQARIQPAREQHARRHVCHRAPLHRLRELAEHALLPVYR